MATSPTTSKPVSLSQKAKRPPNLVQPHSNGIKTSFPQPSPSPGSKRPSLGSKLPPNTPTLNGNHTSSVGAGSRVSNRRRDSQKAGDAIGRPNRGNRPGQPDGTQTGRLGAKRLPEPLGELKAVPDGSTHRADLSTSSQNHSIHPQEIPKISSLLGCSPPPDSFSIRSARWELHIQLADETVPGACQNADCSS